MVDGSVSAASSPANFANRADARKTLRDVGVEAACKEALVHFERHGRKRVERKGRIQHPLSDHETNGGCQLMRFYFYGLNDTRMSERVTKAVRFGFAITCIKHNLTGLPGQGLSWYEEYELRARTFLNQRSASANQTS
jgi:hypothetical protein